MLKFEIFDRIDRITPDHLIITVDRSFAIIRSILFILSESLKFNIVKLKCYYVSFRLFRVFRGLNINKILAQYIDKSR